MLCAVVLLHECDLSWIERLVSAGCQIVGVTMVLRARGGWAWCWSAVTLQSVCVCLYMCVCMFMCVYVCVFMYMCMFRYVCLCMYVYVCTMYVCLHVCVFMYVCICTYVCMYVCM